jgi:hypothetical protein
MRGQSNDVRFEVFEAVTVKIFSGCDAVESGIGGIYSLHRNGRVRNIVNYLSLYTAP